MELDENGCRAIESLENHKGFHLLQIYMEECGLTIYGKRLLGKIISEEDRTEHNVAVGAIEGVRKVFTIPMTIRTSFEIWEEDRIQNEAEARSLAELKEKENNDGSVT
jgi:hypothetical protein